MVRDKPKEVRFENIIGNTMMKELNEFDGKVREYYISLDSHCLRVFDQLMNLFALLMLAIGMDVPGFKPKFLKPSSAQAVLASSACGSFRNLRIANKLLLEGYYLEMHATLRMVEQWLECSVIVEGNPDAAALILESGLAKQDKEIEKAIKAALNSSEELRNLYKSMQVTFRKLSQRCHPLGTAFDLIRKKEAKEQLFVGGIVSEEMFEKQAFALTDMAVNSLNILSRHFNKVPLEWHQKFVTAKEELKKKKL